MSNTIDERVVEMRFDNAQFERNVQTSMSTLDKLKQKLNLSGASKGLEDVGSAAKKVDLSGLGSGIETVSAKFSALQVMGVTALANITNSAVNAGKKIVSALTIDPVKSGFQEYETQMNAVQTILANTQKEGTNVKIVNKALDELNEYADKTIYNFTEMTRNIGTFTAAGVKLDASVSAIKGIANLAAVSGSTSQQASTAMYQLSQAISSGTVRLMDWNSVVNAGMGGQVFQDALIRTSEHLQTGAKAAVAAEGSFRESLKTGWLTTEVLTQTLDQFATAADTQEEYEAAIKKFVDQGYTQEEAKQMADMARTAGNAATKVKTFTQLIDTLKEALGSGWSQTWRLIIGDFEEAKELWTKISDVLGEFINKMSNARNKLVEGVMSFNPFTNIIDKLNESGIGKVADKIDGLTHSLEYYQKVVNDVWKGDYKNSDTGRYDLLDDAGYNHKVIQDLVNKGYQYELTIDDVKESEAKFADSLSKTSEEANNTSKSFENLSDEQLRNAGLTDDEIVMYRDLEKQSKKTGKSIEELVNEMSNQDGRTLFWESLANIGKTLIAVFSSIKEAFSEIFPGPSVVQIYGIISSFNDFTKKMILNEEQAKNLKLTFKGLFAAIDIVRMVLSSGLSLAFKALKGILSAFDMDILEFTGYLGEGLVMLRDWIKENDFITKGFALLGQGIKIVVKAFKNLFDTVKGMPKVQSFIETLKNVDWSKIGENIVDGLKNGLKDGITSIPEKIAEIGKAVLEKIKEVLGIHSPSTEMYDVGKYTIEGFINGIKDGAGNVGKTISDFGSKVIEWIKDFDFSKAFAVVASTVMLLVAKNITDILGSLTAPLDGVGDLLSGVGKVLSKSAGAIKKILNNTAKVVKSFSKVLNAKAFTMKATAIKDLAISLAILAGVVFLLSQIKTEDIPKLWNAVGVIFALSAILVGLSVAMDKLSSSSIKLDKEGLKVDGIKASLIGLSVALILMAATAKILGSMNTDQYTQGMLGLVALVGAIILVFAAFGTMVKGKSAQNIDKAGKMLKKMAVTLLLMIAAVKLIGMLKPTELAKGAGFVAAFVAFVALLSVISMIPGKNISKLGSLMIKISLAMMLMVGVVKLAGSLEKDEIIKGIGFAAAFLAFLAILEAITLIPGKNIDSLGSLMLKISASMILMVGVVKLVSLLKPEEMGKGALFAAGFLVFLGVLVAITKIGSEQQIAKVGGMVLAVSVAIAILAGVCVILSLIDTPSLWKGVGAVTVLGVLMAVMIRSAKDTNDVKGSILAMAVTIAILAAAVAVLSFIKPEKLFGATVAMGVLMALFALIEHQAKNLQGVTGSLVVMAIIIAILGALLIDISTIPTKKALISSAALSLVLLSLAGAMYIISKTGKVSAKAIATLAMMALIVGALALLIETLTSLSGNGIPVMAMSLILLAGSLAAIAIAVNAMNGAVAGAAALTVVALALSVLLPVIQQLGSMSLAEIGMSLLMLAGTFGVIGLAGLLLGPVTPVILALSVAITLLGIGALAAGTGIYMFAIGLQTLAATGPAGITALTTAMQTLITMIPMLITTLITSLVTAFVTCIPIIVEGALMLITSLLTALAEYSPTIVQAGFNIIMALLNGIKNNTGSITTTAVDIIINFINAISEKMPDVIQAGVDLVFAFIDGIGDAFENNGERAREALIDLGKSMLAGIKDFFGIHSPSKVFEEIGGFLVDGLIGGIGGLVEDGVKAVVDLGASMVSAIGEKASDFLEKGKEFATKIKDGIKSKVEDVKRGAKSLCTKVKDTIKEKKKDFESSGEDLMQGLKNGMENMKESVTSKAKDIGNAVSSGFKKLLGIHSPSKVFAQYGRYIDEGLIQGLDEYSSGVSKTTNNIGKDAIDGMSRAISHISDLINGDIDTQPTIRPVLDLSDVKSGAGAISGMIGDGGIIGLRANVNAISSMMNQNRQNGTNDDVVSAINKLNNSLNKLEKPSYVINGITYDDGSNVTNAVESLVRAARLERRL